MSLKTAGYDRLVGSLGQLADEVGDDETHPLASLVGLLGSLVERYEDESVPTLEGSSVPVDE